MANIKHKDFLIISVPRSVNFTGLWTVTVDISTKGERFTVLPVPEDFKTSDEATNWGLQMGKQWVDKRGPQNLKATFAAK